MIEYIEKSIMELSSLERKVKNYRYFQGQKGGYGEGDEFIGVTVPNVRKVNKNFEKIIGLAEIERLLHSKIHEFRLSGLLFLVYKYQKCNEWPKKVELTHFYLSHLYAVNNWDLVDSSAYHILGATQFHHGGFEKSISKLVESKNIWKNRVAIISTLYSIRKGQFEETLEISNFFLHTIMI